MAIATTIPVLLMTYHMYLRKKYLGNMRDAIGFPIHYYPNHIFVEKTVRYRKKKSSFYYRI